MTQMLFLLERLNLLIYTNIEKCLQIFIISQIPKLILLLRNQKLMNIIIIVIRKGLN